MSAIPFYMILIVVRFCLLFENIICEYLLLLSTKKANRQSENCQENHLPFFYGFRSLGSIIGCFYGGRIIERFGNQECFYLNSILPILLLCICYFFNEKKHPIILEKRDSFMS